MTKPTPTPTAPRIQYERCPVCDGCGYLAIKQRLERCAFCAGTGRITIEEVQNMSIKRIEPEVPITDPAFRYTSAVNTNIRKRFAALGFIPPSEQRVKCRHEHQTHRARGADQIPIASVKPLKRPA